MKEVTNIKQLNELVNRVIEEIAEDVGVDTLVVSRIIERYSRVMSGKLEKRIIVSEN